MLEALVQLLAETVNEDGNLFAHRRGKLVTAMSQGAIRFVTSKSALTVDQLTAASGGDAGVGNAINAINHQVQHHAAQQPLILDPDAVFSSVSGSPLTVLSPTRAPDLMPSYVDKGNQAWWRAR